MAIGKAIENEIKAQGERRGRPKAEDAQAELIEREIPANLPELTQGKETRQIAAEKAGFDSTTTYRQAKAVVEKAEPELVAAMDSGAVAISTAAKLVSAHAVRRLGSWPQRPAYPKSGYTSRYMSGQQKKKGLPRLL